MMKALKSEVITVREDFMQVDAKEPDSKDRISLGRVRKYLSKKAKIDSFKVFVGKDGDVLLRPSVSIPARELWLYKNSSALSKVKKGLQDAQEGKTEEITNLDQFIQGL